MEKIEKQKIAIPSAIRIPTLAVVNLDLITALNPRRS
jgi:hypothetical protein